MKNTSQKNNIGMIGAIIGATLAVSYYKRDGRLLADLKKHAKDIWEDIKDKGDTLLNENLPDPPTLKKK